MFIYNHRMSESAPIPTDQGRNTAIESAMHFATPELVFPEIVERYGADRVFEVARTIHERNLVTHGTESENIEGIQKKGLLGKYTNVVIWGGERDSWMTQALEEENKPYTLQTGMLWWKKIITFSPEESKQKRAAQLLTHLYAGLDRNLGFAKFSALGFFYDKSPYRNPLGATLNHPPEAKYNISPEDIVYIAPIPPDPFPFGRDTYAFLALKKKRIVDLLDDLFNPAPLLSPDHQARRDAILGT